MTRLYTVSEIETAFNNYDSSGDGKIERDEFVQCITKICPGFKPDLAREWFDEIDKDHSGFLDIEEFTYCIRELESITNKENMFISLWNVYDQDKNGVLDLDEFKKLWKTLISELDDETLERFFKVADNDGNGTISYVEYMEMASTIDEKLNETFEDNDN